MKPRTIACVCMAMASVTMARDIIVSPTDRLAHARDMARAGDRILLHGGVYRLNEPLVIGPEHSGVTWMAYPGERPVLSGGVPVTGWTAATNGQFKATVQLDNFRQLWVNGRRAKRARGKVPAGLNVWGKHEAVVKTYPSPPGLTGTPGYLPGRLDNISPAGYTTTDATLAEWRNPGHIEFGYFSSWTHMVSKIEKITKTPEGALIVMSQPVSIWGRF